jgi:hypothetical protein
MRRAIALQRDAMWMWLNKNSDSIRVEQSHCDTDEQWRVASHGGYDEPTTESVHPDAIRALAAAVRYVVENKP